MTEQFIPPKNWLRGATRTEMEKYIPQQNEKYKRLFKLYKNLIKAVKKEDQERIAAHLELVESEEDFESYVPDEI